MYPGWWVPCTLPGTLPGTTPVPTTCPRLPGLAARGPAGPRTTLMGGAVRWPAGHRPTHTPGYNVACRPHPHHGVHSGLQATPTPWGQVHSGLHATLHHGASTQWPAGHLTLTAFTGSCLLRLDIQAQSWIPPTRNRSSRRHASPRGDSSQHTRACSINTETTKIGCVEPVLSAFDR